MNNRFTLQLLLLSLCAAPALQSVAQNNAINLVSAGSQYVSTGLPLVPDTGPFTVELWAYVPAAHIGDPGNHTFVFQGSSSIGFYIGYDGTVQHITAGDAWNGGGDTGWPMPSDQWVHLAITGNLTNEYATFYVNGQQIGTMPVNTYTFTPGANFQMGVDATGTTYTDAKIDQVRVWGVERSQTDIQQGMYLPVPNNSPGLLVAYDMDESSTTTLTNNGSYSSAADGTFNGGVTRVPSPIQGAKNAISLNGINSQVNIDANTLFEFGGNGTIETWVYPTAIDATRSTIISNSGAFAGSANNYSLYLVDNGGTKIGLSNNTTFGEVDGSGVPLNTWTHLAFAFSGGAVLVYVNGTYVNTISQYPSGLTGQFLNIGIRKTSSTTDVEPFRGSIDDVRMWGVVRSAIDIAANKNLTLTGQESGLNAYWNFDQGIAGGDNTGIVTAVDLAPNALNGTLANFSLNGASSNFVTHDANPLPVKMTSFTVTKQGTGALVQWQTAQEQNSKNFSIQRSSDGIKYTGIGTVAAAGNTTAPSTYAFTDPAPADGKNYYRLLQTDLDGQYTYSTVRVLVYNTLGKLVWYSTGNRSVEVSLQQGSNEQYTITDVNGRSVRTGQLSGGKTSLSGLTGGMYLVKVTTTTGAIMDAKVIIP